MSETPTETTEEFKITRLAPQPEATSPQLETAAGAAFDALTQPHEVDIFKLGAETALRNLRILDQLNGANRATLAEPADPQEAQARYEQQLRQEKDQRLVELNGEKRYGQLAHQLEGYQGKIEAYRQAYRAAEEDVIAILQKERAGELEGTVANAVDNSQAVNEFVATYTLSPESGIARAELNNRWKTIVEGTIASKEAKLVADCRQGLKEIKIKDSDQVARTVDTTRMAFYRIFLSGENSPLSEAKLDPVHELPAERVRMATYIDKDPDTADNVPLIDLADRQGRIGADQAELKRMRLLSQEAIKVVPLTGARFERSQGVLKEWFTQRETEVMMRPTKLDENDKRNGEKLAEQQQLKDQMTAIAYLAGALEDGLESKKEPDTEGFSSVKAAEFLADPANVEKLLGPEGIKSPEARNHAQEVAKRALSLYAASVEVRVVNDNSDKLGSDALDQVGDSVRELAAAAPDYQPEGGKKRQVIPGRISEHPDINEAIRFANGLAYDHWASWMQSHHGLEIIHLLSAASEHAGATQLEAESIAVMSVVALLRGTHDVDERVNDGLRQAQQPALIGYRIVDNTLQKLNAPEPGLAEKAVEKIVPTTETAAGKVTEKSTLAHDAQELGQTLTAAFKDKKRLERIKAVTAPPPPGIPV